MQPQISNQYNYKFESWGKYDINNLELKKPSGISVDSHGNLYVADTDNDRIQIIKPNGNITSIGNKGSALGEFSSPTGIVVDNKDNLYIADTNNHRIQKGDLSILKIFKFNPVLKF